MLVEIIGASELVLAELVALHKLGRNEELVRLLDDLVSHTTSETAEEYLTALREREASGRNTSQDN